MKKLIIAGAVLLSLLLPGNLVLAQTAPTFVAPGLLIKAGGESHFAVQVAGNINILSSKDAATGKVTKQVYTRIGGYLADMEQDSVTVKSLENVTGYAIAQRWWGDYSISMGVGIMASQDKTVLVETDPETGLLTRVETKQETKARTPILLEGGWSPIDGLTLTAGGQYIPVEGSGDMTFLYGAVAIEF